MGQELLQSVALHRVGIHRFSVDTEDEVYHLDIRRFSAGKEGEDHLGFVLGSRRFWVDTEGVILLGSHQNCRDHLGLRVFGKVDEGRSDFDLVATVLGW